MVTDLGHESQPVRQRCLTETDMQSLGRSSMKVTKSSFRFEEADKVTMATANDGSLRKKPRLETFMEGVTHLL